MSGDLYRDVAQSIVDTMPGVMQSMASELRRGEHPLPLPHFRALMILGHFGSCTVTDLAEKQHVRLPTMSNTVSLLVDHGWAERHADRRDRRRARIRLTRHGSEAVRRMRDQVEDLLAERLRALSAEELKDLERGLAVLRKSFDTHPSETPAGGAA